jgi:ribosome-associated protein
MPPAAIPIPRERLTIRFARSGGPGGQNVNKVETKVEVRFVLDAADWIPAPVRERLRAAHGGALTREGELVVRSSRGRTQGENLRDCLEKLEAMLAGASRRPRRRVATAPTRGSKERKARAKRRRSEVKRARAWRGGE